MGIIQLKEEQSSALAQLHDSLVDSLNKRNELDKEIKKQIEEFDKIVSELKSLNKEYEKLNEKMKDSINLTSIDAQKARDIVFQINDKKDQKQKLEPMDKDLYERYLAINEEIDDIKEKIDGILNSKQENEVKEAIYVKSLNSDINVINTNVDVISQKISSRSIISKSDISTIGIIERIFRKNGIDIKQEEESIHSKLEILFNNRNAQSYEESALLDNLQYYKDKKDDTNVEPVNQDNNLKSNIPEVNKSYVESSNITDTITTSDNSNNMYSLFNNKDVQNYEESSNQNNNLESSILEANIDKIEPSNLTDTITTSSNSNNIDINSSMYKLDSVPNENIDSSYVVTITSAMNPVKIANSTQSKKTSILNNFSKKKIENTIIKTDIKPKEVNNVIDINQFLSMNKAA